MIERSWQDPTVLIGSSFGKTLIRIKDGRDITDFTGEHVQTVTEIDSDIYRNAGVAAAGAIVGGILTGGIGFLAGAAFGGRRRKKIAYFVHFTDGRFFALESKKASELKVLQLLAQKSKVSEIRAATAPQLSESPHLIAAPVEPQLISSRAQPALISAPRTRKTSQAGGNFMVGVVAVTLISLIIAAVSDESIVGLATFMSLTVIWAVLFVSFLILRGLVRLISPAKDGTPM